jgi:hypothetical protein
MGKNLEAQLRMNTIADTLKSTPVCSTSFPDKRGILPFNVLKFYFQLWDEITIQEEAESGNAVQSQIRVPMNPSFPLQQSLFKVCQEINHIGPHAIPK